MDSQWLKFEVFEKERADLPHRNAGSVHAPDPEMALENARDVFVRRPQCQSLWVVPEDAIFSKTIQELQDEPLPDDAPPTDTETQSYLVFQKQGQIARETFVVHVGQVNASSPVQALVRAVKTFGNTNVFVWWIVPDRAVVRSETGDIPSMFEPAQTKSFRQHLAYPVEPVMRELKSAQGMLDQE